jgi:hypothetical protein
MDGGIAEGGLSMVRRRVARFLTPALLLLLVPPACALGQMTEVQPPAEMLPTPPVVTSTQPRGPFPISTEPSVCIKQADVTKYWFDICDDCVRKARQAGIAADVAARNLELLWSDAWVAFFTGRWDRLRAIMRDEEPQAKTALEQANAEYREWCGQAARARAEYENALRECAFEWRRRGLRTEVTKVHHGFSATSEATWYEQVVDDSGEAIGTALVEALPPASLSEGYINAFEPGVSAGDFDKWLYGRVTGTATSYWHCWCIAHESPLAGRTEAPAVVHCEAPTGPTDWPPVPPTPLGGKVHPGLPEPGQEYLGVPGTWE